MRVDDTREFIPFHVPSIGEEEIVEVVATLRSGWLTTGARTSRFEQSFAQYVGAPHAIALNSCTAALHLALAGLGIGPGDEVITTPLTFCATINTILQVGATPVLADIRPDGNIDPEAIRRKITPRTRAIVPVHIGGLACDMQAIWEIAKQHNVRVIEDAAHAAGTLYRGRPIGSAQPNGYASDAVAFSFYATKGMTTGEGGMLTTHNPELANTVRILALHGISKDAWKRYAKDGDWFYEVVACGFKYNMSDIQSAIGIHQLSRVEEFINVKTQYAKIYNDSFVGVDELEIPPDQSSSRHSWHLYVLRLNLAKLDTDRKTFIHELQRANIGCSVHFIPIPLHPYYANSDFTKSCPCPQALELYKRIISLPIYPAMSEEEVRYVASTVKRIVFQNRKQTKVSVLSTAAVK
ncbi:MAG: DegT/DnrJ/EryC1/StrS family aminotransferase [Acidobacteriota bacterium]|nr:DegT/DnrJ/EryC1/StrS family aminotransferase [Acidobacteriota bacterium]